MKNKLLWTVIALLTATSAGEGYYIYNLKNGESRSTQESPAGQDKWIEEARKNLSKGLPIPFQRFDELFNDDFFGRKFDPFAEIESFHKKLNPMLSDEEGSIFKRSWNDWVRERMEIADVRPEITRTDKEVIVSFKVPGLEGETLNVDVNGDRIRIAYDAKAVQDKADAKTGSRFKSESVRRFEKILPIPEQADPMRSRIVREGNAIKIIFAKRENQRA